jgi:hypothetical protein
MGLENILAPFHDCPVIRRKEIPRGFIHPSMRSSNDLPPHPLHAAEQAQATEQGEAGPCGGGKRDGGVGIEVVSSIHAINSDGEVVDVAVFGIARALEADLHGNAAQAGEASVGDCGVGICGQKSRQWLNARARIANLVNGYWTAKTVIPISANERVPSLPFALLRSGLGKDPFPVAVPC